MWALHNTYENQVQSSDGLKNRKNALEVHDVLNFFINVWCVRFLTDEKKYGHRHKKCNQDACKNLLALKEVCPLAVSEIWNCEEYLLLKLGPQKQIDYVS